MDVAIPGMAARNPAIEGEARCCWVVRNELVVYGGKYFEVFGGIWRGWEELA